MGPVKAPLLTPNSWLSAGLSGIAAQFTAMKLPRRPDKRWIRCAKVSLPVPVSPSSKISILSEAVLLSISSMSGPSSSETFALLSRVSEADIA